MCLPTQNRAFIHHSFPECVLTICYVLGSHLMLGVQRWAEGDNAPVLFGANRPMGEAGGNQITIEV